MVGRRWDGGGAALVAEGLLPQQPQYRYIYLEVGAKKVSCVYVSAHIFQNIDLITMFLVVRSCWQEYILYVRTMYIYCSYYIYKAYALSLETNGFLFHLEYFKD